MGLTFSRCRDASDPLMDAAMALYRRSFPAHELRLWPDQQAVMNDPLYHFDLCLLDGALAGLILYWDFGAYIYVEHFCVEPSMRSHGLGTLILAELARLYPDAKPALHFANPFQLLVAVILSAQCTDVKVNMVTPALFAAYPDAAALAKAEPEEIEPYIKTCGLFHNKAKNLVLMARELVARFGGEVPADHDALESLPGVGRKTANVVMSCAFGEDAIAVDTHVFRVTNRLGLADAPDVLKTEHQLMQAVPKDQWSRAHHWLIYHGRRVCAARKPACETCTLRAWCDYANGNPKNKK